jgi:hypothetical protein
VDQLGRAANDAGLVRLRGVRFGVCAELTGLHAAAVSDGRRHGYGSRWDRGGLGELVLYALGMGTVVSLLTVLFGRLGAWRASKINLNTVRSYTGVSSTAS